MAGTRETRFKQPPRSDSRATQGSLAAGSCSVKAGDPWKQRGSCSEQTYGSVPGQKVGGVELFLQEIGWEAEALPSWPATARTALFALELPQVSSIGGSGLPQR